MSDLYEFIIESTKKNELDREVAVNLIKKIKEEERKVVDKDNIAIIGISLQFSNADGIEEWEKILREGVDCVSPFPVNRKQDLNNYFGTKESNFYSGAYLNQIDNFDYSFFSISPKEASLMDPCQRLFLQKAWQVIEDAGYKPEDLYESRTGVYVGYSTDFGESYKAIVDKLEPSAGSLSTAGNIHSIIGSRISHILSLRGPSIMIDTACSSSLVAVHLACKAIQNKECNMAIAGGIKLNITPTYKKASLRTGIESSTERTRAFDDASDGTGLGEGCALIFLKPLKSAIQDKDNIYAVIKGSAINHDGNSIGITAPNAESQEDVIIRAWRDAQINPETIHYIEAHGTGTSLGDPIEIEGLTRAFRRYTNKRQFCGVGSVKTNIGHLDNTSGIAGLIKVVLSLNKHKLYPSINFSRPNRNIDFKNSPVYVNDILREWKDSLYPRRCGVSSFGLSGTNCHMVIEEAPKIETLNSLIVNDKNNIFKLSAKTYESLYLMLIKYNGFLEENQDIRIEDLCFTSNTRRSDYSLRIVMIVKDIEDLKSKINKVLCFGIRNINDDEIYFGENSTNNSGFISINKEISLKEIACKYIEGFRIQWNDLYDDNYNLVKIPTYQFSKSRCWVGSEDITHPFLKGEYVEYEDKEIFISIFSAKNQWVVNEHSIYEKNVSPGTVYVEMANEIGKRHFRNNPFEISDITFLYPMSFEENEVREVRTTVVKSNDYLKLNIESRGYGEDSWVMHATGRIRRLNDIESLEAMDINMLKAEYSEEIEHDGVKKDKSRIKLGPRWETIRHLYRNEDSILVHLTLNEKYYEDSINFNLHPALLDMAVNILMRDHGDELYLPFSYKNLKLYGKMPNSFYSILRNINNIKSNTEIASYSITMIDEEGRVFAEVENYSIKKVNKDDNGIVKMVEADEFLYKIKWVKRERIDKGNSKNKVCILLFKNYSEKIEELSNILEQNKCETIKVRLEDKLEKISSNEYVVGNSQEEFLCLFKQIREEKDFTTIIDVLLLEDFLKIKDTESLEHQINDGILSLFNMTKALVNYDIIGEKQLLVLSNNAYEVLGTESSVNPLNASVLGFAKVIDQEYKNINVKCIDITDDTEIVDIVNETLSLDNYKLVALRDKDRFTEELVAVRNNGEVQSGIKISDSGAYVITGGTGGIGIEIAKYLSLKNKANICLINRSGFIPKEQWDEILSNSQDEKLKEKIKKLKTIEESGSIIEIYKADISVENQLAGVLFNIREKFKSIKGVFHAAGVVGDGFIMGKEKTKLLDVIKPKVLGTWLLDKYTTDDNLEMFVLFSSITSKTGGQGQSDYTAANAFLDTYAAFRNRKSRNTIAVNWAPWRETGMAFDYGTLKYEGVLKPISTVDAITMLDKVIAEGFDNVIIGKLNNKFLSQNIKNLSFELGSQIRNEIQKNNVKSRKDDVVSSEKEVRFQVVLAGKDNVYSENEILISQIVGNVIGMRRINVHETFKNLGIDSIVASIIVRNIDEELPNIVSIADFYTYSTISQLASYIDKKAEKNTNSDINYKERKTDLKDLLRGLKSDDVSGEDILKFLNEWRDER